MIISAKNYTKKNKQPNPKMGRRPKWTFLKEVIQKIGRASCRERG